MRARDLARCVLLAHVLHRMLAPFPALADAGIGAEGSADVGGELPEAEPPSPAGYREAISEAIREYNARNFPEAHTLFARAHALLPSARTLRGLGVVEFELKRYRESILHLQAALDSEDRALLGRLREKAEKLLQRARRFVGSVQLQVEPECAEILVDGEPIESADELWLRVGDHVLEFRAPDHIVERRDIQLSGGEQRVVQVTLRKRVTLASQPAPTPTERPRWFERSWVWASLLAVAAGTGVATAVALRDRGAPLDRGTTGVVLSP